MSDVSLRQFGLDARALGFSPFYLGPEAHDGFAESPRSSFEPVSKAELSLDMYVTLLRDSENNNMA